MILLELRKGEWARYRLLFGSRSWSHTWKTQWIHIRFAQTERLLMDALGLFYDLTNLVYGGSTFGIRRIAGICG